MCFNNASYADNEPKRLLSNASDNGVDDEHYMEVELKLCIQNDNGWSSTHNLLDNSNHAILVVIRDMSNVLKSQQRLIDEMY